MTVSECRMNLGSEVIYTPINAVYVLRGVTIRLGADGYYYLAELLDRGGNSVLVCGLDYVKQKER